MKLISLFFFIFILCFSQKKGNGHFVRTNESVDKFYKLYSPLMINFNTGLMLHQSVEIPEINYQDGLGFQFDADFYLFQGMYLTLSSTVSKTTETYHPFVNSDLVFVTEKSEDYTYFTPILGIKYYFRSEKEFANPWFLTFGLGKNYFLGKDNFDRFSAMFELGKITDIQLDKAKLYFSIAAHVFEGKGFRPYLLNNGYVFNTVDFKTYTSIKFNIGLHLNITGNTIRF